MTLLRKKPTIVRDYKRLTEREEADAFCVLPDNELWGAIIGTIYDHIDDARMIARDVRLAKEHGALAHACGAMDALETLIDTLQAKREKANEHR